MLNDIKNYIKQNERTLDDLDDALKVIVKNMEKMILVNLKNIASKRTSESEMRFVDQIYKAESWVKIQNDLYNQKSTVLNKFFKKFKVGIDDLKKAYPESNFQNSALSWQWNQYDKYIKNEFDIMKLLATSESDVLGIARLSQLSTITDINSSIISTVEKSLRSPISHLQTRLQTSNSAISNNLRQAFFKSIKAPAKKYIYVGVLDGKTRTFCRHNIGRIKSEAGWKRTENGQIGNAWEYAGGFNCRHYVLYISDNWSNEEVDQLRIDFQTWRV